MPHEVALERIEARHPFQDAIAIRLVGRAETRMKVGRDSSAEGRNGTRQAKVERANGNVGGDRVLQRASGCDLSGGRHARRRLVRPPHQYNDRASSARAMLKVFVSA